MPYTTCPKLKSNGMQTRRPRSGNRTNESSSTSPTTPKTHHLALSNISGKTYFIRHQAKNVSTNWETGKATVFLSSVLLLHIIATLTLLTWILIVNSHLEQGWKPQHLLHECHEQSKPWFFSTFALPATLEDQRRLKKVSNSVFTTQIHWGALSRISGVFWIWICTQSATYVTNSVTYGVSDGHL